MKKIRVLMIVFCFLISLYTGSASDAFPVYKSDIESGGGFLISNWDKLPFKTIKANDTWINYVNTYLNPKNEWNYYDYDYWPYKWENNQLTASKCLSYSAATVNDWFSIQKGKTLSQYQNFVNNRVENGTNPRELEEIYFNRYGNNSYDQSLYDYAVLVNLLHGEPVTYENIPYDLKGYADILTNPPINWINRNDSNLGSNYIDNVTFDEYLREGKNTGLDTPFVPIPIVHDYIKKALEEYGILYAQLYTSYVLPVHAATLIGYGDYNGYEVFWIHETYDQEWDGNPSNLDVKYKGVYASGIFELIAFYDPQWPTYHHDNRRTGATLLKGDMEEEDDIEPNNLLATSGFKSDFTDTVYARNSIADIDGNGEQEVVTVLSSIYTDGWLYAAEKSWKFGKYTRMEKKWKESYNLGYTTTAPPTLANIDDTEQKEIIIGLYNGTLLVLKVNDDGDEVSLKWSYTVQPKADEYGTTRGKVAYTAASDIDNDGKVEIIFTDFLSTRPNWPGELYVLEDDGDSYSEKDKIIVGNGGAFGAISLADIDSDDKQEIIVPTYYGVRVYDYDNDELTSKSNWNGNSDGKLESPVVVYDIDRDNEYEVIYATSDTGCGSGKTCYEKLYVRDAQTSGNEDGSPLTLGVRARTAPSIGDVDNDGNAEIILAIIEDTVTHRGEIKCYEKNLSVCSGNWPYDADYDLLIPYVSPNLFDVDGDGNTDVLFPSYEDTTLYLVDGNGDELFTFEFDGEIGSTPSVGDFDGDSKAEIAVKRAGSPYTILSLASGLNNQPTINSIENITAIAGELININESGTVSATDEDGDDLTFYYSSPFNESGLWQTTINDTGNYSVLVEVSDGNLSDYTYLEVKVFNSTAKLQNQLNDSSTSKELSFSGPENKTVYIRLPKNATVIYSELKLEGKAP